MSWSWAGRIVLTLALLVGAGASAGAAAQEDPVSGPKNHALLDTGATRELLARARTVSEELFTFTYTDLTAHEAKFAELTTGDFSRRYAELFESIVSQARTQQLSLRSTVADLAVRQLDDEGAEVLVFLDQTSTRADTGAQNVGKAMFLASLERVGGTWKFANLDLLVDQ
jgi:Mce-associated membrane protein